MNIKQRIYNDFFRPSKENEYERILQCARDNGYEFHTMLSFEDVVGGGQNCRQKILDPSSRY